MNKSLKAKTPALRLASLLLLMLMLFASCADNSSPVTGDEGNRSGAIALIAPDPATDADYLLMHGFLDTADSLGLPARLFTFDGDTEGAGYTKRAADDGWAGAVLVGCDPDLASELTEAGIPVITLLSKFDDVNAVLIDESEFYTDVADFMAEKLTSAGTESGTVLIYGADENADEIVSEFESVLSGFTVKAYSDGMSMNSVCGIYAVTDTAGALDIADGGNIVVIGSSLTDDTAQQFDSGLYALCIAPYYEAAAQSVISMEKLLNGNSVPETDTLNRVIVTSSGISRYISERYRALLLFDLVTPSPAPTAVLPTDEPETTESANGTEEP